MLSIRSLPILFESAFRFEPGEGLIEVDSVASACLQDRLKDLGDLAMDDPAVAEEFGVPSITRFYYLASPLLTPGQRGILYRLDRKEISPLDAVRWCDRAEMEFVRGYDGKGDLFADGFYRGFHVLGYGVRTLLGYDPALEPALILSAREICSSEISERLPAMDQEGLLERIDLLEKNFPRCAEAEERIAIVRDRAVLSFLLTLQGVTSPEMYLAEKYRLIWSGVSYDVRRWIAALDVAWGSPNPFDRASVKHRLIKDLEAFVERYRTLTPSERISADTLVLEAKIGEALFSGRFGSVISTEELDALSSQSLPPHRKRTASEILESGEPVEVRFGDLPDEWLDLARSIPVMIPESPARNLMEFLEAYVSTAIFTPEIPLLDTAFGDVEGTANRLLKTVVLKTVRSDGRPMSGMALFATLAHEAYHNFFFRLAAAKDPSLLTAKPLEERCARLFHAMALKACGPG